MKFENSPGFSLGLWAHSRVHAEGPYCFRSKAGTLVKYVSRDLPAAIIASSLIAFLAVVLLVAFDHQIFPDTEPSFRWDVWANGSGDSRSAALADLATSRTMAMSFLSRTGFSCTDITEGSVSSLQTSVDGHSRPLPKGRSWFAQQPFSVTGTSYTRFAALSDQVVALDPEGTRISSSFPPMPFQRTLGLIIVLAIISLSLSGGSLETRAAITTSSPRGMHPAVVASQTLTYALFAAFSIAFVHVASKMTREVYIIFGSLFFLSLSAWLIKTRTYWSQTAFLSRAYKWYVAVTAGLPLTMVLVLVHQSM